MNCGKFEELLTDYLDGQLARAEAAACGAHALQCRACRGLLAEVKAALSDCKAGDGLEIPGALAAALADIPAQHAPLDCAGFEELISDFLDGFVPAHTYSRFETHAADCCHCGVILTDVVYAVAACHSVHTYEEVEIPEPLVEDLLRIMPEKRRSRVAGLADRMAALAAGLMPRATQGPRWSFATASALMAMTFALLLLGFSDDMTVAGIYRKAHVKAAEIYSEGTDIYARKDEVIGQLQQVGEGIGEIWDTLGGEPPPAEQSTAPAK